MLMTAFLENKMLASAREALSEGASEMKSAGPKLKLYFSLQQACRSRAGWDLFQCISVYDNRTGFAQVNS